MRKTRDAKDYSVQRRMRANISSAKRCGPLLFPAFHLPTLKAINIPKWILRIIFRRRTYFDGTVAFASPRAMQIYTISICASLLQWCSLRMPTRGRRYFFFSFADIGKFMNNLWDFKQTTLNFYQNEMTIGNWSMIFAGLESYLEASVVLKCICKGNRLLFATGIKRYFYEDYFNRRYLCLI